MEQLKGTRKVGKFEAAFDLPFSDGGVLMGEGFGIAGKNWEIAFEGIHRHHATILMLDEEPDGNTFAVLEPGDVSTHERARFGVCATLSANELDDYIVALQRLAARMKALREVPLDTVGNYALAKEGSAWKLQERRMTHVEASQANEYRRQLGSEYRWTLWNN